MPSFYPIRKIIRKLPGDVIHEIPLPEPTLTQGFGAREQAGAFCKKLGLSSVLLVTDETLFSLGFHEKVVSSLEREGVRCTVFHEIASEPTVEIITAGREAALSCKAEGVIALGGGSVLDSSKIIAACAAHPNRSVHLFLLKFALVHGGTLPLITIPSTAGTGAEHTVGAVVKNDKGVKQATVVIGLKVPHVILDSELMLRAPRSVTVWCGIDALSHGLEGLLSDTRSAPEDVEKSRECVRLALQELPRLLEQPEDIEARQRMSLAAFYGGNAINKQLAGYVHAFAHSIGGLYHIPHGKAIAWSLLPVVECQKELCKPRLAALAVHCGLAEKDEAPEAAAEKLLAALRELLTLCGLEPCCEPLREEDYKQLIRMIDADSVNYSPPKTFSDKEIETILEQIRKGERL